ncbi:TetR/AcrR family transcriptional regulator [Noviherbaspirillum aerium]|uniref:TetR/AcrR family transcriptional regulator n=1 Tax=Noviherbaspirillum aerium TaxID=2588497 RepID=UPI00124D876F|nr:TetR/AcrR family transcriptional regulator [Noviherbaspirillum aerium]
MRYPPGHKEEKRKELLKASGALVKDRGFAASGVDALTEAAGVTSGAFYSHFASKNDLLKALIESELQSSREMWAGNPHQTAEDWIGFELDRYLSMSHVRHPEAGCVLPALGAEIARAGEEVRAACAQELARGIEILEQRLGSQDLAWAFLCQMVGAILMARTMPNQKSQRAVIESSKGFLQKAVACMAAAPDTDTETSGAKGRRKTAGAANLK